MLLTDGRTDGHTHTHTQSDHNKPLAEFNNPISALQSAANLFSPRIVVSELQVHFHRNALNDVELISKII